MENAGSAPWPAAGPPATMGAIMDKLMPAITETDRSLSPSLRAAARAARPGLILAVLYAYLFAVNLAAFKFGHLLPLPAPMKELFTSMNYFDYARHPQYRHWAKGFVLPSGRWTYDFRGDTYHAPGAEAPRLSLPVDEHGFVNAAPPESAQVLFIGDSFTRGAGCRLEETIPSVFGKLSKQPGYSAAQAGFGLSHYREVLRHFAEGERPRFHGRRVFVMVYLGNDVLPDMKIFRERATDEAEPPKAHLFQLRTLYHLAAVGKLEARNALERSSGRAPDLSIYQNLDSDRQPYLGLAAPPERVLSNLTKRGFYPHFPRTPAYRNVPVAFNTHIRRYKDMSWLDEAMHAEIGRVLDGFRTAGEGLEVRWVILPTKEQVLGPYLPPRPASGGTLFDEVFPAALRNFEALSVYLADEIRARGFPVLDTAPLLRKAAQTEVVFFPGDTHMTPAGNRVVAEALSIWTSAR